MTELRKAHKLHDRVESRLVEIFEKIMPDYHPIKEPQALAGGRNDLILFEFTGKKVLFEVLATLSQVSRDLRILDKTKADVKIAVIIDKEVDKKVFDKFLRENPEDNYPFIFIRELFDPSLVYLCALKMLELIKGDEEARFQRLLKQKFSASKFLEICKKEGIKVLIKEDLKAGNITLENVFITILLRKLLNLGINHKRCKKIGVWISENNLVQYIIMKVQYGFNIFLYTDFEGNMAINSDIELLDWIRIGYTSSYAYILLSMNALLHEIIDKYLKSKDKLMINREIKFTIGQSQIYDVENGRVVSFSIPKKTKEILIFRPMKFNNDGKEKPKELTEKQYLEMIKIY